MTVIRLKHAALLTAVLTSAAVLAMAEETPVNTLEPAAALNAADIAEAPADAAVVVSDTAPEASAPTYDALATDKPAEDAGAMEPQPDMPLDPTLNGLN